VPVQQLPGTPDHREAVEDTVVGGLDRPGLRLRTRVT
jgi:hypothetical protein